MVERLLTPDMWSGWGVRILSAQNPAYSPLSYQLGSVCPHDNGLIALGFKRYGFAAEAARVAGSICDAASHFQSYRLPELYAGIERQPGAFPVQYLGANVPQAWAAGTVFHLLQALLRLFFEFGVTLPPEWGTFFRALVTLDGTLTTLAPGFSGLGVAEEIVAEWTRHAFSVGNAQQPEAAH